MELGEQRGGVGRQKRRGCQHRRRLAEKRWSLLCGEGWHPKARLKSVQQCPRQGREKRGSGIVHVQIPRRCYPR